MSEAPAFDWIPFYEELADQLVAYRNRQTDLIQVLEELRSQGCKITPLEDRDEKESRFLLKEIDPFTFFGTFNRGVTNEARIHILKELKKEFKISTMVPSGFTGVPILNAQKSWFFSFKNLRKPDDVDRLWEVFIKALEPNSMQDTAFENAFDRALEVRNTYINLTMGLFWIRPTKYISLDSKMQEYLKVSLPDSGLNFQFYKATLERVLGDFKSDLPHLSHEAHLARRDATRKILHWERANSSSFDLVVSNPEDLDSSGIAELFDLFMKSECKPQPGFSSFLRDDFAAWVRNLRQLSVQLRMFLSVTGS